MILCRLNRMTRIHSPAECKIRPAARHVIPPPPNASARALIGESGNVRVRTFVLVGIYRAAGGFESIDLFE